MRFIELATIADQTLLITPRNAGQILRFGGEDVVTSAETPVRVMGSGLVELSEGWWDALLIVAGEYFGPYFDGDTTDTELEEYSWTGTPRESTSRRRVRSVIERPQTDAEYAVDVDPTRRFLHDVGLLSAPALLQNWAPAGSDFRGRIMEFKLGAESPAVLGIQRQIALTPSLPFLVQDEAYNLITNPSAEAAGSPIVIAGNYSKNPSVEVNASDWSYSGTVGFATVTAGRTTELAAVGSASYRVRVLGDGGSLVEDMPAPIYIQHDVDLAGVANNVFRVSIWAAGIVAAGEGYFGQLGASIQFFDSGGTMIGVLGFANDAPPSEYGGHVFTGRVNPPAGSVAARIRVFFQGHFTRSPDPSRNGDLRMYCDAAVFAIQ